MRKNAFVTGSLPWISLVLPKLTSWIWGQGEEWGKEERERAHRARERLEGKERANLSHLNWIFLHIFPGPPKYFASTTPLLSEHLLKCNSTHSLCLKCLPHEPQQNRLK